MNFTRVQIYELMRKHIEKGNGLHCLCIITPKADSCFIHTWWNTTGKIGNKEKYVVFLFTYNNDG